MQDNVERPNEIEGLQTKYKYVLTYTYMDMDDMDVYRYVYLKKYNISIYALCCGCREVPLKICYQHNASMRNCVIFAHALPDYFLVSQR